MSFKDIYILALMAFLFCQAERILQFGRGYYEEHFCEIEFGPVVKDQMSFKDISIFECSQLSNDATYKT